LGLKFSVRQQKIEDISVSKTRVFARSKHLKVFDTSVFLETKVFIKYFTYTLIPNRAQAFIHFKDY
jgi:hypothetical protein